MKYCKFSRKMEKIDFDYNSVVVSAYEYRYTELARVFTKVGLSVPTRLNNAGKSCEVGHLNAILLAKSLHLPYIIIFEDDAYPSVCAKQELNGLTFPPNADIVYLSFVGTSRNNVTPFISGNYINLKFGCFYNIFSEFCSGAHAYVVMARAYDSLIHNLARKKLPADLAISQIFNCDLSSWVYARNIFIQKNVQPDFQSITYLPLDEKQMLNNNFQFYVYYLDENRNNNRYQIMRSRNVYPYPDRFIDL